MYCVMYEHNRYRGKDRGQSGLLLLVHQEFPFTRKILNNQASIYRILKTFDSFTYCKCWTVELAS